MTRRSRSSADGPAVPLYCAGAELEAYYPVSVITDGVGLNITVMSYRDHVDFGIVVDRDMAEDAWSFADAITDQIEEMKAAVLPREPDRELSPA